MISVCQPEGKCLSQYDQFYPVPLIKLDCDWGFPLDLQCAFGTLMGKRFHQETQWDVTRKLIVLLTTCMIRRQHYERRIGSGVYPEFAFHTCTTQPEVLCTDEFPTATNPLHYSVTPVVPLSTITSTWRRTLIACCEEISAILFLALL